MKHAETDDEDYTCMKLLTNKLRYRIWNTHIQLSQPQPYRDQHETLETVQRVVVRSEPNHSFDTLEHKFTLMSIKAPPQS